MIAQLDKLPDNYLTWWLIALGGVALLVQTALNIVDRVKGRRPSSIELQPDPIRIEQMKQLANKDELTQLGHALEADIEQIRQAMSEERKVARDAHGNLHKRIDDLAEAVAEMKGLISGIKENTDRLLARSMQ